MSERTDPLDRLFDALRDQRPPAPFAAANAVRRRGRQRARRQAVSAGAVVLVVAGLGAGGAATVLGGPAPPVPPVASLPVESPAVPSNPAHLLLTGADLGAGWEPTTHELFESDPPWYWADLCREYRAADYPSLARRHDLAVASYVNGDTPLPGRVDQVVELYQPDAAATNLADVWAVIGLCSRQPAPGDEEAPIHLQVEQTGFTGDESLLIGVQRYAFGADDQLEPVPHRQYVAVVRVGDVVSTTIYGDTFDATAARDVARIAAERLD